MALQKLLKFPELSTIEGLLLAAYDYKCKNSLTKVESNFYLELFQDIADGKVESNLDKKMSDTVKQSKKIEEHDEDDDLEPLKLLTSSSLKSTSTKKSKKTGEIPQIAPETKNQDNKEVESTEKESLIQEKIKLSKSTSKKEDKLSSASAFLNSMNRDIYKVISELQIEQMT